MTWRPIFERLGRDGWPAGAAFALLGGVFGAVFVTLVFWLALDQHLVLEGSQRLHNQTVPSTLEHFRLARNIEQLRLEGERVFSGRTPESRQQALFVVSLVASHPSLVADTRAALLAAETERFLVLVAREGMTEARYAEWATLANRLSLLADDVSVEGVNLATDDLRQMSETMMRGRLKLTVALALVAFFVVIFLLVVRRHLIRPLQMMSGTLASLRSGGRIETFPPAAMAEIRAVEGAIGQLQGVMQENEEARRQLELLATTDGLTGLFNRRHFMRQAAAEIARAQRYGRPVCVGLADLDCFKQINDSYGHGAGDTVLQSIAGILRQVLRQSESVCRYGGEEFAFVFPETTLPEAMQLAERLRLRVAEAVVGLGDGTHLRYTLSMGVANASGCSLEKALQLADEALYEAKRQGRNRVLPAVSEGELPTEKDWLDGEGSVHSAQGQA